MTHQPAISFSISIQDSFNRAGGRTSNFRQKIMKFHLVVAHLYVFLQFAFGGQSALKTTYQPLDEFSKSDIVIVPVTCLQWYSNSASSAVDLIGVRNVPPTDNPKEANEDLNLASVCGVKFSTSDLGLEQAPLQLTLDATKFGVPKRFSGHAKEDIVRACLECLRRCTPDKLKNTPVTLKCGEADKEWLTKIVTEFNASDRSKAFFTPR